MSRKVTIEIDDALLASLGVSEAEFAGEACFLLAAKLYELGRLSSGQSAKLCCMDRVPFLMSLRHAGVTVSNLRPEDAEAEIAFGRRGLRRRGRHGLERHSTSVWPREGRGSTLNGSGSVERRAATSSRIIGP